MKNQNDLIFSIVAAVIGLGIAIACFFMKGEPVAPPAPQTVVTTTSSLTFPAVEPTMANGLPGGGSSMGGMGGGMGMGMGMARGKGPSAMGRGGPGGAPAGGGSGMSMGKPMGIKPGQ